MAQNINTVNALTKKKKLWLRMSRFWKYIHWVTGILGVCMSTLAAAGEVSGKSAPVFSVIAAICFGIIGFANPQKQSSRNEGGYLLLEYALLKYDASILSIEELFEVYGRAEAAVHEDVTGTRSTPVVPPPTVAPKPGS